MHRPRILLASLLIPLLLIGCAAPATAPSAPSIEIVTHTPAAKAVAAQSQPEQPGQAAAPAASVTQSAPASTKPVEQAAVQQPVAPTAAPTTVTTNAPVATQPPTAQPRPTFDPQSWETLPVIPELSPRAIEILKDGLAKGNNPRVFSKIGDCESRASWFLGDFDTGPRYYALGEYESELAPVIEYYAGSFKRVSLAAQPGFTAASLQSRLWADKKVCEKDETPLACEYRLNRPLVAFIMLGSNDASNPKTFEGHLRKALDFSIEQGVLPILGTKADNTEGDHFINATIARLAYEYDIPLWNYWLAVQDLPSHGLQEDGVHLTFAGSYFDRPEAMKKAWPVRNLNALQILRRVMDQSK